MLQIAIILFLLATTLPARALPITGAFDATLRLSQDASAILGGGWDGRFVHIAVLYDPDLLALTNVGGFEYTPEVAAGGLSMRIDDGDRSLLFTQTDIDLMSGLATGYDPFLPPPPESLEIGTIETDRGVALFLSAHLIVNTAWSAGMLDSQSGFTDLMANLSDEPEQQGGQWLNIAVCCLLEADLEPAAAPEPAGSAWFGVALLGLALMHRRTMAFRKT